MTNPRHPQFHRRHLPHVQPPGATLCVTFRLAGSIPHAALDQLRRQAEADERLARSASDPADRSQLTALHQWQTFDAWDRELNATAHGPRWLSDLRVARMVRASLNYRDGRVMTVDAFCIMPNHVHLVCTPLATVDGSYQSISTIMQSLKG